MASIEIPYDDESVYLAFDPGETIGWAGFDENGKELCWGQIIGMDALADFLEAAVPCQTMIIEDFLLRKDKALVQSGSNMYTSQVIGMLKTYARMWKCEVVMQTASIKSIAELWSGVKPTGSHKNSHWVDAYNHGVYYLQKNGIRKSKADRSAK